MSVIYKKDTYVRFCKVDNYYVPISEYNTYRYEYYMAYYIIIIDTKLELICSTLRIKDMCMITSYYVMSSRGI